MLARPCHRLCSARASNRRPRSILARGPGTRVAWRVLAEAEPSTSSPAQAVDTAASAEQAYGAEDDQAAQPVQDGGGSEEGVQVELRVSVASSMSQVPQEEWDALATAGGEVNPFISWAFLHALEASGSAVPEEGWGPQHVLVRDERGKLVGAVPLYLKSHSYGEYTFDQSWANYCSMLGGSYYPKLQSCVPFTPVTGPRLLAAPGPLRGAIIRALGQTLIALAEQLGVSSLHLTFLTGEEWAALGALGFLQRRGIQYHWENAGYATWADFEADLKQSRRKSVRQERKGVARSGLRVRRLTGRQVTPDQWRSFHRFYRNTVDKRWGSAYLKPSFFPMLGEALPDQVLLVVAEEGEEEEPGEGHSTPPPPPPAAAAAGAAAAAAGAPAPSGATAAGEGVPRQQRGGRMVAGALNLVGSHAIYGRNWGCEEGREVKHLHFELCYYSAVEEAIERGLPRVEAGAQGEHKISRGYLPNYTYSCHWIRDPQLRSAVGRFLDREANELSYAWQALTLQGSPFKQERTLSYMADKLTAYNSLGSSDEGGSLAASVQSTDADADGGDAR